MKMDKKDVLIANDLLSLEITIEKADVVLDDLRNVCFTDDYYPGEEPGNVVLKRLYHEADIRSSILCDYITEAQETINNIKKNLLEKEVQNGKDTGIV